jgi:hypothetical protein
MTELTSYERVLPRLKPIFGKVIPYSKLWKILASVPSAFVQTPNRGYAVWYSKNLVGSFVIVTGVFDETGIETSCVSPIIHTAVVSIEVIK